MTDIQYEVDEGLRPIYELEMHLSFVGDPTDRVGLGEGVGDAAYEAVQAARRLLEDRGFVFACVSHGAKRL